MTTQSSDPSKNADVNGNERANRPGESGGTSGPGSRDADAPPKKPITGKAVLKLSLGIALLSGILELIFTREVRIGLFAFAIAFVALYLGFLLMLLVERRIDRRGDDDLQYPRL